MPQGRWRSSTYSSAPKIVDGRGFFDLRGRRSKIAACKAPTAHQATERRLCTAATRGAPDPLNICMCIYIYIYVYLSIYLSIFLSFYRYIYIYMYVYIHTYHYMSLFTSHDMTHGQYIMSWKLDGPHRKVKSL